MSNLDQEAREAVAWLEAEFEHVWRTRGRVWALKYMPGECMDELRVPIYYYSVKGHNSHASGGMMSLKK